MHLSYEVVFAEAVHQRMLASSAIEADMACTRSGGGGMRALLMPIDFAYER